MEMEKQPDTDNTNKLDLIDKTFRIQFELVQIIQQKLAELEEKIEKLSEETFRTYYAIRYEEFTK